ncbi:glycosyltransferase family 25 protein [Aminobacter sp. HY435]|uniref:glycosyltransferase family 25 protein n=1 Tax=Aminobacter sp. HY435 TaxID=2970917 RepID=UPI0022B9B726|nr:glycosyltransferase family 25 protein [Aminobacter sp. HY435]
MRSIYLNLERSRDRREWMEGQAKSLGTPLERLPAVDGAQLGSTHPVSPSALGCFLSHRSAWELAATGDDPYVAIFEDDIHLSPELPKFLQDACWIPTGTDLVHLGCATRLCEVTGKPIAALGRRLFRPVSDNASAEAYIISKECARQLHRDMVSIDREFDQILFNGGRPDLTILKLFPSLAMQDQFVDQPRFEALIHRERIPRPAKLRGFAKAKHEAARAARQVGAALGIARTKRVRVGFS